VAFFGINVNPHGLIADMNCTDLGYRFAPDVADATARYLKEVQGVDYAIMVSHIGYSSYEPTEPNDTLIIGHSHYIDMVISSHSHTTIKPGSGADRIANADGKLIPIGQNGKSGKLVATYDLDLETGNIVYNHIPVDASWDEAASRYTAMNRWLDKYRHGVDSIMNNPVATSARFLKNSSDAMQNWVSDAAMDILKDLSGIKNIDCAIMNKGGIRADMPKGTVTEGVIGSMFPFDNRFVVLEMPGNELIESIKLMCGRGGDAVSKELKATYNEKGELLKATLKGKKIDPNNQGSKEWPDEVLDLNNRLTLWAGFIAANEKEKLEATDLVKTYNFDGRTSVSYSESFSTSETNHRYWSMPSSVSLTGEDGIGVDGKGGEPVKKANQNQMFNPQKVEFKVGTSIM